MKVLKEEQSKDYNDFMDTIACAVMKESILAVIEHNDQGIDPREHSEEIGKGIGPEILKVVEHLTKDMDRETILKWFAEIALGHAVGSMTQHPQYRNSIMLKMGLE